MEFQNVQPVEQDGILFSDDRRTLIRCTDRNMGTCNVPDEVVHIAPKAFRGCSGLKTIVLPPGLRYIGWSAFQDCTGLEEIVIPDGVMEIPEEAFSGCRKLEHVDLPKSLIAIGRCAFEGTGLPEIVIPPHVQDIGYCAFPRCLKKIAFCGKRLDRMAYFLQVDPSDVTLFTTDIPDGKWFQPCLRGFVELWRSGAEIPDFYREAYLDMIRRRVRTLWKEPGLLEIILAENLIPARNFSEFLDEAMKTGNTVLTAVLLEYQKRNYSQDELDRIETEKRRKALSLTENLKKLWTIRKLEDGTIALTFYKGDEHDVHIPDRIGNRAVSSIGPNVFRKQHLRDDALENLSITSITMGDGIRQLQAHAFHYCICLQSIQLPAGLEQIGDGAFQGCACLARIELPDTVEVLGDDVFRTCLSLEEVRLSRSLLSVNTDQFWMCYHLKRMIIPGVETEVVQGKNAALRKELTICAPVGSLAQKFAVSGGFHFEALVAESSDVNMQRES